MSHVWIGKPDVLYLGWKSEKPLTAPSERAWYLVVVPKSELSSKTQTYHLSLSWAQPELSWIGCPSATRGHPIQRFLLFCLLRLVPLLFRCVRLSIWAPREDTQFLSKDPADCVMFFPSSFRVKSAIELLIRKEEKNEYLTFDFDVVGRLEKSAINLETPLKGLFGAYDTCS